MWTQQKEPAVMWNYNLGKVGYESFDAEAELSPIHLLTRSANNQLYVRTHVWV